MAVAVLGLVYIATDDGPESRTYQIRIWGEDSTTHHGNTQGQTYLIECTQYVIMPENKLEDEIDCTDARAANWGVPIVVKGKVQR